MILLPSVLSSASGSGCSLSPSSGSERRLGERGEGVYGGVVWLRGDVGRVGKVRGAGRTGGMGGVTSRAEKDKNVAHTLTGHTTITHSHTHRSHYHHTLTHSQVTPPSHTHTLTGHTIITHSQFWRGGGRIRPSMVGERSLTTRPFLLTDRDCALALGALPARGGGGRDGRGC